MLFRIIRRAIPLIIAGIVLTPQSLPSVTVKEEQEMAREFMKILMARFEIIDDPVIHGYVNHIGQKIVAKLPAQPFDYRFYVIRQSVYNAFATPAGNIFIYSGLIEAMRSEEELAGILGHEAAHVFCRHISQNIERSKKVNMATLAGVAAGIFLGASGVAGEAASAVTLGSMAAGQSASLAYSRDNEIQADQVGLKYMRAAGYSGEGLLAVLKKIRSKNWYGTDQIPSYLMTHPAVEDRIIYLDSWLSSGNAQKTPSAVDKRNDFAFVRARLAALYGDEKVVLNQFESSVRTSPSDPAELYGYGLALTRVGDRKKAIGYLRKAVSLQMFRPEVLTALGKTYFLDGQYEEALPVLKSALSAATDYPEALFYLGRIQLELDQLAAAEETFERLARKAPQYSQLNYFLGNVYGRQGKLADAHFTLGKYYLQRRDMRNAQVQFQKALKEVKDSNKRKEIEDYLDTINSRLGKKGGKKSSKKEG